jgi:stage IV sporulation protein A
MKKTGKPYLVIVNSVDPGGENARSVQAELMEKYGVDSVIADCQALTQEDINALLQKLLYAFPMAQLHVYLPRWMDALEMSHPVKAALYDALLQRAEEIASLAQAEMTLSALSELEGVLDFKIRAIDLGTGTVSCVLTFPEALFYEILSARAGMPIQTDAQLLALLTELSQAKREYDKIADALAGVKATGYGVVMPTAEEMTLQTPQILKKGGAYGVKLKAGASAIHMMRLDRAHDRRGDLSQQPCNRHFGHRRSARIGDFGHALNHERICFS